MQRMNRVLCYIKSFIVVKRPTLLFLVGRVATHAHERIVEEEGWGQPRGLLKDPVDSAAGVLADAVAGAHALLPRGRALAARLPAQSGGEEGVG